MKKKSFIRLYLLSLLLAVVALVPACKKSNDNTGAPVITSIRIDDPSPKDTLLSTGNPNTDPTWSGTSGKYVAILGHNLQNATEIDFDGVPATINNALFSPNSAVVQVPAIVFSTVDTNKLYTVHYATTGGSTTFSFKLGPPPPTITAISNVFANPGDSVYLYGTNLVLVQKLVYGGTTIPSYKSSVDGTALGFLMPASTPNHQVSVLAKGGAAQFTINATPTITGINNEDAAEGDSVYITGTYFNSIQSLSFGGTTITSFKSSKDMKTIAFVMPALTSSSKGAPVSVTTKFGSASTSYNVEDFVDGVFQNWDNVNGYPWGLSNTSNSDYPGSTGWFGELNDTGVGAGDFSWWGGGRGVNMGGSQWVPASDISNSPANYAVKFEIYVPQSTPWTGGALYIAENYSFTYIARYTPWATGTGGTTVTPFTTRGWQTVTIPLSSFLTNNGTGTAVPSITALVGSSGNTGMNIWYINDGTTTVKSFALGIDNIRVVKIK